MDKKHAIELLGGTKRLAAQKIGVTYQAIQKWPDVLPPRIADRVLAAIMRQSFSAPEDAGQRTSKA